MGIFKEFTEEETLFERVRNRFTPESVSLIERSYRVSKEMHEGQKRLSGEPYIIHPLNVAILLEDLGMDDATIAAGLLHDVVEDTKYTKEDMIRDFGETISHLVEGVTKISQIKSNSKESEAAENIRKMLLATTRDIRVILIKLADKTHNIRTLKFQAEEKRKRIAREVLSIYAPIAGRLGIYKIKVELEDLAFQVLHPDEYQRIKANISEKKGERDEFIEKIKSTLRERMASVHLDVKVEGRAKHFYSIYKKMNQKEKSFDEILDLRAVRLIVKEMKDCYASLGIVHTIWTPVPGRFKDYIATPKTNMYQSLHTTVIGPEGKPVEVQIRTFEMNQIAENGVAAHYAYKEGKPQIADDTHPFTSKWVELLKSWQDPSLDSREFLEELQHDLHEDEVFIFTPKGEIIEMPKGSNVLDFAFRIHTDIGLHTKGAKINGKMVPIRQELHSGDQLEIITDKKVNPSPIWLRIVKTPSARQKLRQYFRKIQEESLGQDPSTISGAPFGVNSNQVSQKLEVPIAKRTIHRKPSPEKKEVRVIVAGIKDTLVRIASCCHPLPGDEIIGFITKGRGVSVHKSNCETAQKLKDNMRVIPVHWDGLEEIIPVPIEVKAKDVQGIYLKMVEVISNTQTNILEAGAISHPNGTLTAKFLLELSHLDQLEEILDNLRITQGIESAGRANRA